VLSNFVNSIFNVNAQAKLRKVWHGCREGEKEKTRASNDPHWAYLSNLKKEATGHFEIFVSLYQTVRSDAEGTVSRDRACNLCTVGVQFEFHSKHRQFPMRLPVVCLNPSQEIRDILK
jgi:hypothetical protein